MDTDLFALFPDLPWPRMGPHPPARLWPQQDLPPRPRPRRLLRERHSASRGAALREISVIAVRERERLGRKSVGGRALDQIIGMAREALT